MYIEGLLCYKKDSSSSAEGAMICIREVSDAELANAPVNKEMGEAFYCVIVCPGVPLTRVITLTRYLANRFGAGVHVFTVDCTTRALIPRNTGNSHLQAVPIGYWDADRFFSLLPNRPARSYRRVITVFSRKPGVYTLFFHDPGEIQSIAHMGG